MITPHGSDDGEDPIGAAFELNKNLLDNGLENVPFVLVVSGLPNKNFLCSLSNIPGSCFGHTWQADQQ